MPGSARLAERAGAVGLFAVVAFNAPMIEVPTGTAMGLPMLGLYIFGVWGAVIAALALVLSRDRPPPEG